MADVRAAPRYSIVPGDPVEHRDEVLALGDVAVLQRQQVAVEDDHGVVVADRGGH